MGTPKTISYETVVNTVRQWPPDKRVVLVQDILNTLTSDTTSPRPRRKTLERALGLLATSQPAPSDAEVKQWLDERRKV
jgi:hypothetical protein